MRAAWTIQNAIWVLNFLGTALVIGRLISLGLHKRYRFFFAGFCLALARTAALFPFKITDPAYYRIWVSTQPLLWISYVLIVLELYALVLRHYKGIYSLGKWFSIAAVGTALAIAALTVVPTVSAGAAATGRPRLMFYYALIERGVVMSLAILLFLLLALTVWFAVPLNRNLLVHCTVYSAYFFAQNAVLLYWHVAGQTVNRVSAASSIARLSVALVCYICWAVLLTRRGEERTMSLRLGRSPAHERHLLEQLEKLNATLLHTVKK